MVLFVLLLKSDDNTDRKSDEKTPSALELELTIMRYDVLVSAYASEQSLQVAVGRREATLSLAVFWAQGAHSMVHGLFKGDSCICKCFSDATEIHSP